METQEDISGSREPLVTFSKDIVESIKSRRSKRVSK